MTLDALPGICLIQLGTNRQLGFRPALQVTGPRVVDLRQGVTRRDKSPGEPQIAEIS
jgi:hypothetical protein